MGMFKRFRRLGTSLTLVQILYHKIVNLFVCWWSALQLLLDVKRHLFFYQLLGKSSLLGFASSGLGFDKRWCNMNTRTITAMAIVDLQLLAMAQ